MHDPPLAAAAAPAASSAIGPYRIADVLGRGAIEITCVAHDTRRDRDVLLQVLPLVMSRRPAVLERLSHLADVVRQLRHPHLVRLLRFEVDAEQPEVAYFVWQRVPGRTLEQLIREHETGLPVERVLRWAVQLASAVDFLDEHGPGHGGVDPANVIVDDEDDAMLAGAVIWAEVRRLYAAATAPPGKPPRPSRPSAGVRDQDIRGLARLIYAALRGVAALEEPEASPQPISGLSAQLNMTLLATIEGAPDGAARSAGELVDSLHATPTPDHATRVPIRRDQRSIVTSGSRLATTRRPGRRTRWPLAIAAGLAVVVIAASVTRLGWPPVGPTSLATAAASISGLVPSSAEPSRRTETELAADAASLPTRDATVETIGDARLDAAEHAALTARTRATEHRLARHAVVDRTLELADAMLAQARRDRAEDRPRRAIEQYENARTAFGRVMVEDALALLVGRLEQEVDTRLRRLTRLDGQRLEPPLEHVRSLVASARDALDRGDLRWAAARWEDARDALDGLEPTAVMAESAAFARDRWIDLEQTVAVDGWPASMRVLAEAVRDDAQEAWQRHEQGRFEDALVLWERAADAMADLQVARRREADRLDELAAAWAALRSTSPLADATRPDLAAAREQAERLAASAAEDRDCGRADAAAAGFAQAAAIWNEAAGRGAEHGGRPGEVLHGSFGQALVPVPALAVGGRGVRIGATEVTRGQFAAFVEATGHVTDAERRGWSHGVGPDGRWRRVDGLDWRRPGFEQTDDHPVVCVSYNDARAFCDWLSGREHRRYRLPREAEWALACGGGTTDFHWGDEPSAGAGYENAADASWRARFERDDVFPWDDGCVFTCAVASLRPNRLGIFDLHGNVQEWCLDRFDPRGVDASDAGVAAEDDRSPRVIRGGSFAAAPARCRVTHRDASTPETSFASLGFRLALDP